MQITDHAQQRYAERIMDKDTKGDIAVYIANNKDKIHDDINKMVEYGTLIYSGKLEKGQGVTDVYVRDTWVILVDPSAKKVITLYAIDLGVGQEFNNEYVTLLLKKLDYAKSNYEVKNNELLEFIAELREQEAENKNKITEYRRLANELEKANENITNVIADYETQRYIAEDEVRSIVEVLVRKKIK